MTTAVDRPPPSLPPSLCVCAEVRVSRIKKDLFCSVLFFPLLSPLPVSYFDGQPSRRIVVAGLTREKEEREDTPPSLSLGAGRGRGEETVNDGVKATHWRRAKIDRSRRGFCSRFFFSRSGESPCRAGGNRRKCFINLLLLSSSSYSIHSSFLFFFSPSSSEESRSRSLWW